MLITEQQFARMPPHLQLLFEKMPNPDKQIVMDLFPERRVNPPSKRVSNRSDNLYEGFSGERVITSYDTDGSAARFYPSFPPDEAAPALYHPKANKRDRAGSRHPTIKPQGLMRWYCRLVTPPGGTVLDPFAGSGSTLYAALDEGFGAVGIEMEAEYAEHIAGRLSLIPPHRSPDHERTSP